MMISRPAGLSVAEIAIAAGQQQILAAAQAMALCVTASVARANNTA